MAEKKGVKIAAQNRKAHHDYFVEDRYEAGIELFGTEVKSIRAGTLNLKDAYCIAKNGELYLHGMHISPYEHGNIFNRGSGAAPASADAQAGDQQAPGLGPAGRLRAYSPERLFQERQGEDRGGPVQGQEEL